MDGFKFLRELKRRNVYKVAIGYAVVGWLIIQVAATIVPALHLPESLTTAVVVVILLGFPIAIVIAWAFEMTPDGIKRTEDVAPNEHIPQWSRRKFVAFVVILALIAGGLLLWPKLMSTAKRAEVITEKSIAVLPFASLSEDKANAYFADGIQDEILTRLSKIADLKVISRTSTQQFQSKPGNLAEIAQQLGVAHILEGSVQKVQDSVRVNVQLIKAEGDSHLWAETYDRKLSDVFAVESEVSERIADSLAAQLSKHEKEELAHVPTENSDAYEAYLQGQALDDSQDEAELEKARGYFRKAVELDQKFASAWAHLATREAWRYFVNDHSHEQKERARTAAESAMNLRPDASESHSALGSYYYYCLKEYDRALSEFQKARELSPNSVNAIIMTAMVKRRQGNLDESIDLQLQAAGLDPKTADVWVNLGRSYRGQRNFKEARNMFDRALAIIPTNDSVLSQKIETYLAEGDLDGAAKELGKVSIKLGTDVFGNYVGLFMLRRDFEGAIAGVTKHLSDDASEADKEIARLTIAFAQVLQGHEKEARPVGEKTRADLEKQVAAGDKDRGIREILIDLCAVLGDRAEVERLGKEVLADYAHDRWLLPKAEETVARGYAILGDADSALPHLERALSLPSQQGLTRAYLRLDPVWDRIRQDPRFQSLASHGG